jgi:hypothetical protein
MIMKSFKQLLQENQKTYTYRLKTVVPLSDVILDNLEKFLSRYDLQYMSTVRTETNVAHVLEFRDLDATHMNVVDFHVGVPMSAYILQQELRAILSVPEKFLVVRADNEPVEVEGNRNQMLRDLDQIAREKGFGHKASLLSTNREYLDAEQPDVRDLYGDEYNMKFLNMLAQVSATRKSEHYRADSDLNPEQMPASKDQQPVQDVADFNDAVPGVKPVRTHNKNMPPPVDDHMLAPDGNLDDDSKSYFRVDNTAQGGQIVHKIHTQPVRTGSKGARK